MSRSPLFAGSTAREALRLTQPFRKARRPQRARAPRLEVLLLRCILGIVSLIMVSSAGCAGGNTTGDPAGTIQHSVTLTWAGSTSTVLGYNVYRGVQSGGPYTQINEVLEAGMNYVDNTVQSGQIYYYVVTAEGTNGLESVYSNQVVVVIPFP